MSEVASSAKPIDVELLDTGPHRESLKRRLPDWPIKTGREAVVSHPKRDRGYPREHHVPDDPLD